MIYEFKYNQDIPNAHVLSTLLFKGWFIIGYKEEEGFSWIILQLN